MDDFIDPFLSSSSWSELNTSSGSSWVGNITSQANGLLTDSVESYVDEESLKYLSPNELTQGSHAQLVNRTGESNFSLKDVFENNSASESYGTMSHSALTMSSSIESNGSEPSKFAQSLGGDTRSISSVPSLWPTSYSGVSPFIEQGKLQGFGYHGVEVDANELGNSAAAATRQEGNGLHPNFPSFDLGQQMKMTNDGSLPHQQEQNVLHNLQLPPFASGPHISKSAGVQTNQQAIEGNALKHQANTGPANVNGCNGATKPRVRARRGQATDPHSIAERLRREKIAERMKNLQELVPNSNKTDKASMLDEIIDYVKFLQLQVKVLSMSRLGAAGAVLPLITDAQAEGSGSLHLSSVGEGGSDLSEAEENLAFEQEVVKLMESNVTAAMQYLQNKGLCLMPIALASAISSQKGSSSAAIPPDRRKTEASRGGVENGYSGSAVKQEEFVKSII